MGNAMSTSEFHFMQLTKDPYLQPVAFGLFLSMYKLALFGNLLIILTESSEPHLHTPIYFFLSNLSMVDTGFISTTVPRVIVDIHKHCPVISYVDCLTQMSLCLIFGCMDNMLLAVMAYDTFMAICQPLYYQVIMKLSCCCVLLLECFLLSLLELLFLYVAALNFSNYEDIFEISNFFCDTCELLKLACLDTFTNIIVRHCEAGLFGLLPISGIIFSYFKRVSSIMRSSPSSRNQKTSTCGFHLSVVSLFHGIGLGIYFTCCLSQPPRNNAVVSVLYTVIPPMLNTFIFTLRNKDIKTSLRNMLSRVFSSMIFFMNLLLCIHVLTVPINPS